MGSSENCATHLFERADRFCGHCGTTFCEDCLVQPFAKKPPLCKACAIAAAGVRSSARARPMRSRKEIKALAQARSLTNLNAATVSASRADHPSNGTGRTIATVRSLFNVG